MFKGRRKTDSPISGGKSAKKGGEVRRRVDPTKIISPEEYKKQCALKKKQ